MEKKTDLSSEEMFYIETEIVTNFAKARTSKDFYLIEKAVLGANHKQMRGFIREVLGIERHPINIRRKRKIENKILSLMFAEETITIRAVIGKKNIDNLPNLFFDTRAYLDAIKLEANGKGKSKPETEVRVYRINKAANFEKLFGFLNKDFKRLCLSWQQIFEFIESHSIFLKKDSNGTFFLFEAHRKFFVANIFYIKKLPRIRFFPLKDQGAWVAARHPRLVVPLSGISRT